VKVVVLVGGVGGARFLVGLKSALGLPGESEHEITAVVNVGDDIWMHGLRVCPDLDTCMYTLGGGADAERGWGRVGETWTVRAELAGYGAEPGWFGLGDRDLATHLVRTQLLRAGVPLTAVTARLCERWQPGVTLLPVSDHEVETHVLVERGEMHFEEWWVRHRAELPAHGFVSVGSDDATISPAVAEWLAVADAVLLAPSNPVVSIGAMLAVPGLHDALRDTAAGVVGLSPIVAGRPLRGMADSCLAAIGVPSTAEAVGRYYGARRDGGLLDGWLVHTGDEAEIDGVDVRRVPLLMTGTEATAEMARQALELAGTTRVG
jgi:LPPG:FO 2-phospho-L-lactate transferase